MPCLCLQFYITFTPTPHLDGKHVVFGAVEAGWSTLMMMEGAGSDAGNVNPPTTIIDCRCAHMWLKAVKCIGSASARVLRVCVTGCPQASQTCSLFSVGIRLQPGMMQVVLL